ncbi:MAG: branched-chain amino acid ABC transporter permease [Gammaproteobacteria bacterium]
MKSLSAITGVLVLMLPVPWLVQSEFFLNFAIMLLFSAFLGQAWNVLGGYGGQFSFGHAAFFGTGAYATAVLQTVFGINPWVGFVLAGLAGAGMGLVVGFLSFRFGLKGAYFALVTLAFAEVLRILANTADFTGAGVGILIPLDQGAANLQFADKTGFYLLALALVALGLFITAHLDNSRFGARLMAVRENEDAARASGVNVFEIKLRAIALSSSLAGLAGAFYTQYFLYLDPTIAYGPTVSIEAILVPIIGGTGTLFGPLLGAAALHTISEITQHVAADAPGLNLVVYGVLLVLMVLVLPSGLWGLATRLRRRQMDLSE